MRAGGTYPMPACVQLYNLPLAGVCASLDDDTLRLRNEVTLQRHFLRLQPHQFLQLVDVSALKPDAAFYWLSFKLLPIYVSTVSMRYTRTR